MHAEKSEQEKIRRNMLSPTSSAPTGTTVLVNILVIFGLAAGLIITLALGIPFLKDDNLNRYSGAERRVAEAAIDIAYSMDVFPFFFYFIKATVEDVSPLCSSEAFDKGSCNIKFDPIKPSTYKVKIGHYTLFGVRNGSTTYRGLHLGF
jgi:hypothetical protein